MHLSSRPARGAGTVIVTTISVIMGLFGGVAAADPSRAPNLTTGTANCGTDGSFTFVATGNSGRGTSWNGAFVESSTGHRAIFHPASLDFAGTSPEGPFTENATKPSGPGPVACTVNGSAPGVTLTGTVTGTLTWTG